MRIARAASAVIVVRWSIFGLFLARSPPERGRASPDEDRVPIITIFVPPMAADSLGVDSVRRVAAPPVTFHALVRPDPTHFDPVAFGGRRGARLVSVAASGRVRGGESLAVAAELVEGEGSVLKAHRSGVWRAYRRSGEEVYPGDTLSG